MEKLTPIIFVVLVVFLLAYIVVWCWAMWVAFTLGDDAIACFGRRLLKRLGL